MSNGANEGKKWVPVTEKHKDGSIYVAKTVDGEDIMVAFMAGASLSGSGGGWVAFVDYDDEGVVPCSAPSKVLEA
jgi:hypothetical protein